MQLFFIITAILIGILPTYLQKNEIKCLEASQTFPLFSPAGVLTGYDTSTVRVYTFQHMVMYRLSYLFDSSIKNHPSISEKRTHHFVYIPGEAYGTDYDKRWVPGFRKIAVADIFRMEWIKNNNLYNAFVYWSAVPEKVFLDTVTNIHWRYFTFYDKKNSRTRYATCRLGFSCKIRNAPISLSRELDSMYGLKLIDARFYYDKLKDESRRYFRDSYTSCFSLKEVNADVPDSILQYFRRFLSDGKKGRASTVVKKNNFLFI